jgi:hypothetical protein
MEIQKRSKKKSLDDQAMEDLLVELRDKVDPDGKLGVKALTPNAEGKMTELPRIKKRSK